MQGKVMLIIGAVLVVLGVLGLIFGGIPEERHAIEIGEASIGVTETREIPAWMSWTAVGIGIALGAVGFNTRK
jgi:hypothetical protein